MTKDKSSEIHISESIVKSSGCEKVLDITPSFVMVKFKIYVKKLTENCEH